MGKKYRDLNFSELNNWINTPGISIISKNYGFEKEFEYVLNNIPHIKMNKSIKRDMDWDKLIEQCLDIEVPILIDINGIILNLLSVLEK